MTIMHVGELAITVTPLGLWIIFWFGFVIAIGGATRIKLAQEHRDGPR